MDGIIPPDHTPATRQTTLGNGLRVLTVGLPHLHTASVVLLVRSGARFETSEDNGLSHFVEHMLFRGTRRYPSSLELNRAVEELGGTLHAETGRDLTLLHVALAPELVPDGLAILGEILCAPAFGDIERERALILEELSEDEGERGAGADADDLARALVFGDHPLAQRVIGPRANLRRFSADDVRRHFATHYCARNVLVCAAGPVSHGRLVTAARRHLSALAPGAQVPTAPLGPQLGGPRYRYVSDAGTHCAVAIVLRGLAEADPAYAAQLSLLRAIDDGMSTPLHYELCDQRGLAYSLEAAVDPMFDTSLVEVVGSCSPAKTPALVADVLALLGRFRDQPIDRRELDKIHRRYHYDLISMLDDSYAMASWYGGAALYGVPAGIASRREDILRVTAQDICGVARRVFSRERLAVAVVGQMSPARQGELRSAVAEWQ